MRNAVPVLAASAAIIAVATPSIARKPADDRPYRVSYDARRGVYCIRLFSDGLAADPRPGGRGTTCRTRDRWAQQGVFIAHRSPAASIAAP